MSMIGKMLGNHRATALFGKGGIWADLFFVGWIVYLCFFFGISQAENIFAKNKKLKPEEVVAQHLKSIGSPEALEATKSRIITGTASVEFTLGAIGNLSSGQSLIASDGRKLAIAMKYEIPQYPGEHFAFDGNDVTVGYIDFGKRSKIGEFIRQFFGLIKEGLLGGTLSVAWPLLDIQERLPKLRYREREIDGRRLHELEYSPKSRIGMEGLEIRLYFDFDTFRHVMTEYLYNYRLYPGSTAILKERFDDFGKVDGMILPHKYTIEYSTTTPSFIGCWILDAEQWRHNSKPDPEFFRAPRTPR